MKKNNEKDFIIKYWEERVKFLFDAKKELLKYDKENKINMEDALTFNKQIKEIETNINKEGYKDLKIEIREDKYENDSFYFVFCNVNNLIPSIRFKFTPKKINHNCYIFDVESVIEKIYDEIIMCRSEQEKFDDCDF